MASDDPVSPAVPAAPVAGQPAYQKLPGRMPRLRLGSYGVQKLYLGDDHLLQVESVFFVEYYKRFAYRDIRAVRLRRTPRGLVLSVIFGVLAAGFGVLGWGLHDPAARWPSWGIAAVFALLVLTNVLRGETCRCQLETAVGARPLLSLHRLRPARRALALLTARIVAVQGEIPPADAEARMDEARRKWSDQPVQPRPRR